MRQITYLVLGLIFIEFVYPQNLPRFLRGDEVCCMDRDKYDLTWGLEFNYAKYYFLCGDVVVSFLDDRYWIDFDGKNDQPWHRSLIGNSAGGTDFCVNKLEFEENEWYFKDPRSSWFRDKHGHQPYTSEISDFYQRRGYRNIDRLNRLGGYDYDISKCQLNYAIKNKNGQWATTLQECHETAVSDGNAAEFGNFADCYDECKEREHVCVECPNLQADFKFTGDETCQQYLPCFYRYNIGKLCPSKCGSQGVCCRHNRDSDGGYCQESVNVGGDVFNHNMDMGTYNHHGCVPKPRDPKTCKCESITEALKATHYIDENYLLKPCPQCEEGFTTYLTRDSNNMCTDNTECTWCNDNHYPLSPGGQCTACSDITETESPKCGQGHVWHDCANTRKGSCRSCGPDQYTKRVEGQERTKCFECTGRVEECNSYNAILEGCAPDEGICECKPGYRPEDPKKENITNDNPCIPCESGYFKTTTANEKCTDCATRGDMYSSPGSTNESQCTCTGFANEIPYRFAEARECRQCKDFQDGHLKPYKPADSSSGEECISCPSGTWFDTDENPATCTDIPIMQLDCALTGDMGTTIIDPTEDHYPSPFFNFKPFTGNPVPDGYYLSLSDYSLKSCDDECSDYQYVHLCGKPDGGNIYLKNTGTKQVELLENIQNCDDSSISEYTIKREGVCKDCTVCPDLEFNSGCERNNAGDCVTCRTSCEANQYLYHEKPTGCRDSSAISDYECKECKKVEKQGSNGFFEYFIVESCGNHDYDRWDSDVSNGVQEVTCTNTQANTLCNFDEMLVEGISISRTYLSGSHLPYCPPGYKVDDTCFDANPNTWNKDCCIECEPDNREKKKSANYQQCSGTSKIDTQIWTDRCENNYYTDTSGPEEVCKPCEVCT